MALVKLLKIASDGIPLEFDSAADEIALLSGKFGNVKAAANAVTSEDTNGDLALTPNGTGDLVLDGVNWPQADGTAAQVLQTNGAGQTSWVTPFASQVKNAYTADEALAARDVVYISAADNVSKAIASGGGAASRAVGLTTASAIDTASVDVQSDGIITGFSGLTAGDRMYLSAASAGLLVNSVPSGSGNTIVQIGYAKSASEVQLQIAQLGRRA